MIDRLSTDRLTLRRPAPGDWPAFCAFFLSDRAQYVGGGASLRETWADFAQTLGHWQIRGYGMFTVTPKDQDDRAVALVGPWHPVGWPEPELGWLLFDADMEGQGIAFEAASAARDHVFHDLGWPTAVSYIDRRNARSQTLARRLGAELDPMAPVPGKLSGNAWRHTAPGGLPQTKVT